MKGIYRANGGHRDAILHCKFLEHGAGLRYLTWYAVIGIILS